MDVFIDPKYREPHSSPKKSKLPAAIEDIPIDDGGDESLAINALEVYCSGKGIHPKKREEFLSSNSAEAAELHDFKCVVRTSDVSEKRILLWSSLNLFEKPSHAAFESLVSSKLLRLQESHVNTSAFSFLLEHSIKTYSELSPLYHAPVQCNDVILLSVAGVTLRIQAGRYPCENMDYQQCETSRGSKMVFYSPDGYKLYHKWEMVAAVSRWVSFLDKRQQLFFSRCFHVDPDGHVIFVVQLLATLCRDYRIDFVVWCFTQRKLVYVCNGAAKFSNYV